MILDASIAVLFKLNSDKQTVQISEYFLVFLSTGKFL